MHTPVLLSEVLETLAPKSGDRVLDCTVGLGGHAKVFLDAIGESGRLIGLDADERNLSLAAKNLTRPNVMLIHANFGEMSDCLPENERIFDVILADLGLSSPHLDDQTRGFSFHGDASLDMRFDQRQIMTAAKVLKNYSDDGLEKIFREFGELPHPKKLVACIRSKMKSGSMERSGELNVAVKDAYGYRASKFLPQVYQSLRMAVNREMDMLAHLLTVAPTLLAPGGRLGVISFHSLEDKAVKQAFRALSAPVKDSVTGQIAKESTYTLLTKRPISPDARETAENPRARSAKFRALRRLFV